MFVGYKCWLINMSFKCPLRWVYYKNNINSTRNISLKDYSKYIIKQISLVNLYLLLIIVCNVFTISEKALH